MQELEYVEDVLKNGFEQTTISHQDDYEGKVISTLVRKRSNSQSSKDVLYIHGFNDYFFQKEMSEEFNEKGYNFYALDLRKYGRSILPNHKMNNVRDLSEYFEEIDVALSILKFEKNDVILLSGHSTGGLIATLYASDRIGEELFDCLFCNSPFYDMNLPKIQKKILIPTFVRFGCFFPNLIVNGGISRLYGQSLHKDSFGEWEYNLDLKPHIAPQVNLGWIYAIYKAHLKIKKGVIISKPMLILCSNQSTFSKKWSEDFHKCDAILNVYDILEKSELIHCSKKEIAVIEGGIHDLILSRKPIRSTVYTKIFNWLDTVIY